jgi:two-component system response regulator YesN
MLQVIIADDERKARNVIKNLGRWKEFGLEIIGEAEDGDSLCTMVNQDKPDIIITDMKMPGVNGSELIRRLMIIHPGIKLIIISGYDDFVFAKQAIHVKAVDYLLKPIDEDQLTGALLKAVTEIRMEKMKHIQDISLSMKVNEADVMLKQRVLNKVIQGLPISQGERNVGLPIFEQYINQPHTIVLLRVNRFHWLYSRYGADNQLLYFALINIINELVYTDGMTAFRNESETNEIVLLVPASITREKLVSSILNINHTIVNLLEIEFLAGVGSAYSSLQQLAISLEEARSALMRLRFIEEKISSYDKEPDHSRASSSSLNLILSNELKTAIELTDLSAISKVIEQMYRQIYQTKDLQLSDLRAFNQYLIASLEQLVSRSDDAYVYSHELDRLSQSLYAESELSTSITMVLQFLSLVTPSLANHRRKREQSAIYSIKNFIEEYYLTKLSLHDLATRFFLSEEHISRAFKETFGINLFEYIMLLRIERAKILLANHTMVIAEIVDLLGFVDASHFTKSFKKHTGMTPKEYRNQLNTKSG